MLSVEIMRDKPEDITMRVIHLCNWTEYFCC